jgi:hypothetical protein
VVSLTSEYNKIRDEQASGDARTAAMTDVVRRMMEASRRIELPSALEFLQSADRGKRLFAYAFLSTKPNPARLSALVDSVTEKEDKPFGQYWGLQAIKRNLDGATVPMTIVRQLKQFASKLPSGTDREYELRRILADLAAR